MISLMSAKAIIAILALASAVSITGAAGHATIGNAISDLAGNSNLTAAENVTLSYVDTHYAGNGTAKILKVESDTENGTAVFDINVLAPNGMVYVVHVDKANNTVMSAHLAENQNYSNSNTDDQKESKEGNEQEHENQNNTKDN
ncbi:MAG: hypothetical protein M1393_05020 [Candidatus Thermoplasmatota archaeon]|nr:hypothetical protein [Candidatus Thermoplasmatota archaeon]